MGRSLAVTSMIKRLNARTAYMLMSGVAVLCMSTIFTSLSAYYVLEVGMSPLQLVLVGTAIELTCFVFEVPTGIVADTYSRRLSVLIGGFLVGACYLIEGLVPLFFAIIIAEVIRGIGETFISGANDAWITDEVGADKVGELFMRTSQICRVTGLAGTLLSIILASVFGYQVAILTGAIGVLAMYLVMVFLMPEQNFAPAPREDRNTFEHMKHTFTSGLNIVRGTPVLVMLLLVELVFGASSEGFDRLWEAHMLQSFVLPQLSLPVIGALAPIAWFGIFEVISTVLGLSVMEAARRRLDMAQASKAVPLLTVLQGIASVATVTFALSGNFVLAGVGLLVRSMCLGLSGPIRSTWLNQNIPSHVRATVLSMNSQTNALGQIAGGPGVGWVGNRFGIRAAIALSGLLLTPAIALYTRFSRNQRLQAELVRHGQNHSGEIC